jgi:ATP-dependent protease ClpP protease subunit
MKAKVIAVIVAMFPLSAMICCATATQAKMPWPQSSRLHPVDAGTSNEDMDGGVCSEENSDAGTPFEIAVIKVEGSITETTANEFIGRAKLVDSNKSDMFVVVIDSTGGDVNAGERMADQLQHMKKPTVCIVDHLAASMAFYLLETCPRRLMVRDAVLMAHEPYVVTNGTMYLTRRNLRYMTETQNTNAMEWSRVAAARLKMTLPEFRKRIYENDWYIASSLAVEIGAVDGVVIDVSTALTGLVP